jgi:hypothetical protein
MTTLQHHREIVSQAPTVVIPSILTEWLDDPSEDWQLPFQLLYFVQKKFSYK